MDVNFEYYKIFYFAAKHLNFSEASHQLFISQSAVSQSIKTLEEKMKCKLFVRNTKKVKLTKEGEVLYKHIEQAFHIIKGGEKALNEMHSLEAGEVRIGASDTICKYYLLPYFKRFHTLYPKVKIQVTNRSSIKCVELLKQGKVDFSVVNIDDVELGKNFNVKKLKEIEDIFIAGKEFEHLKDKELSLEELSQYPLMLLEKRSSSRAFFEDIIKKVDVSWVPEIELGSLDMIVELTKIGLGLSFVMKECVKEELKREEIFEIKVKEKYKTRKLITMSNKQIPLSYSAKKFVELLGVR